LQKSRRAIHLDAKFPEGTEKTDLYSFKIKRLEVRDQPIITLRVLDAPGESWLALGNSAPLHGELSVPQSSTQPIPVKFDPDQLLGQLMACDGILFFIDPQTIWAQRGATPIDQVLPDERLNSVLRDMLQHVQYRTLAHDQAPPIRKKWIALCLTKVDGHSALWEFANKFSELSPQTQNSPHSCTVYGEPVGTPASARFTCEQHCPVYLSLGKSMMHMDVPGKLRLGEAHEIRCFALSSIGRAKGKTNVSGGGPWLRGEPELIPSDYLPFSDTERAAYAAQLSHAIGPNTQDPEGGFVPTSINDPDQIESYKLLAPIEWMLAQANMAGQ